MSQATICVHTTTHQQRGIEAIPVDVEKWVFLGGIPGITIVDCPTDQWNLVLVCAKKYGFCIPRLLVINLTPGKTGTSLVITVAGLSYWTDSQEIIAELFVGELLIKRQRSLPSEVWRMQCFAKHKNSWSLFQIAICLSSDVRRPGI